MEILLLLYLGCIHLFGEYSAGFIIQDATSIILKWILLQKVQNNLGKKPGGYEDFRLATVAFADEQCGGGTFGGTLGSPIVPGP